MLIVVLGGGIDLEGKLPLFIYRRLDKAVELYKNKPGNKIVLSGKYSFLFKEKKPPLKESEKMARYLFKKIPRKDILLEKKSKDTVGNAYYLKKLIFIPRHEYKATIITSNFHLARTKFIFNKIFGPTYQLTIVGVPDDLPKNEKKKVLDRQKELLLKSKQMLAKMKDGDHNYLKRKIYNLKYYREQRPNWITNFVAKGI